MSGEKPRYLTILAVIAVALLLPATASADTLPAGFNETAAFTGLTEPTSLAFSPDGRVFVAEKSGIIKVFDNLADPTPTVFADLAPRSTTTGTAACSGMALDPDFPATALRLRPLHLRRRLGGTAPRWGAPQLRATPVRRPPGPTADGCVVSGRLSRLTASGNTMTGVEQVADQRLVPAVPQPLDRRPGLRRRRRALRQRRRGRQLPQRRLRPDGEPAQPCGDPPGGVGGGMTPPTAEGGALRAQDVRTAPADPTGLDGALMRIDPDTGAGRARQPASPAAPTPTPSASSPTASATRSASPSARATTEIWLGDVGWSGWEEINRIVDPPTARAPSNFGWPCYEGDGTAAGLLGRREPQPLREPLRRRRRRGGRARLSPTTTADR